MPHEPKRRHSTGRKGKRRASIKLAAVSMAVCANCGQMTTPHQVCKSCGFYKGAQVVKKAAKATVTRG